MTHTARLPRDAIFHGSKVSGSLRYDAWNKMCPETSTVHPKWFLARKCPIVKCALNDRGLKCIRIVNTLRVFIKMTFVAWLPTRYFMEVTGCFRFCDSQLSLRRGVKRWLPEQNLARDLPWYSSLKEAMKLKLPFVPRPPVLQCAYYSDTFAQQNFLPCQHAVLYCIDVFF